VALAKWYKLVQEIGQDMADSGDAMTSTMSRVRDLSYELLE